MSIRICADGFSLSIRNMADGTLMLCDEAKAVSGVPLSQQLDEALRRPRLMDYTFREVELLVATHSTCVPLEYFRKEEMLAIYRLNFPNDKATRPEMHHQILPSLEVVEVFALDKEVLAVVQALYPDVQIRSWEGCLLEQRAEDERRCDDGERLYVEVQGKQLMVCTFREGKLRFVCTYVVSVDADRTYYVLAVWQRMGLDVEHDTCLLLGEASDELLASLQRFIRKVRKCE